ncbi:MAG: ATP-dependent helicase, partial [Solirubrobacteraceae bacterium]
MLTTAQHEAVTHPGGPLLVIGGAGTGKTRLLVARFAWLVGEGTPAESILTLAFSTAAAAELRARVEERLSRPAAEELRVTTFQGFCARLLHDEALEAGVDPFATPVSTADRLAMLLERIDDLPLRHHDLRGNPSALLGSIVGRIDRLKDELVTCEDYAAWAATLAGGGEADQSRAPREREFAQLFRAHDRLLAESGTLDFGDLVLHAFRLLREKPHVRARLAARYRHVLVDDLQDTSFAQGLLLRLLVAEHGDVTAAGDDDQAIHRFRGASTKAFADFEAEWPAATVVRLEQSFRAGERIVR